MVKTSPPLIRLYEPGAYDTDRWPDSHWHENAAGAAPLPALEGGVESDFAVIGAGYAGLNAALELAGHFGAGVVVLDAAQPGWGASGRNGGFCCMGGARLSARQIVKRYGADEARAYDRFQADAVTYVEEALEALRIEADRGPTGELCLAHSGAAMAALRADAAFQSEMFGRRLELLTPEELDEMGCGTHWAAGGVLNPVGFPLNPLKYLRGLAGAAAAEGARLFADSPVTGLNHEDGRWRLTTPGGELRARQVLVATNGYGSENLPPWIAGRTLPVLSSVLTTRQLSDSERGRQGWSSKIMTYDSRSLLHYYRLLPDNRLLFGMRGAVKATDAALARMHRAARRHLAAMFPDWAEVPVERHWSGLVCLTGSRAPFAGAVPGAEGLYAAFGWHGNGVSAASLTGARMGQLMAGAAADLPAPLRSPPQRFALPALRRHGLRAAYAWLGLSDGRLRRPQGKSRGAS